MTKPCTGEKDVKARIKALLTKHGWFWFSPPANGFGKVGIADILALKAGVFLAIEVKFGRNKPTAPQIAFCNSICAEDGFAFVVNEHRLDVLDNWLAAFARAAFAAACGDPTTDEDGAMLIDCLRHLTLEL